MLVAPVDSLGCSCVDQTLPEPIRRFHILVSLLLSSQTKDEVTRAAVQSLDHSLGSLTPENLLAANPKEIHQCINKVGYHRKKTEFLYEISRRVLDGLPTTLEEALRLPGIGKKMAYLYVCHALGRAEGISVDTHVHRISNRIGMATTRDPEGTRRVLEKQLDKAEWGEANRVFVGFGQVICKAVKPKCNECCIQKECPYYNNKLCK